MSTHYTCAGCGQGFTLSYEEQRWYQEQGWSLPRRCEECRSRRRERDSGSAGLSGPLSQPPTRPGRWPTGSFDQAVQPRPGQRKPVPQSSLQPLNWWGNPYTRFGLLSLAGVLLAGMAALLVGLSWWLVLMIVIAAVNGITLILYRYDKAIAGGEFTRVPEAILLALAFFGGSPAAYATIYEFKQRHKVQKISFMMAYWLIVAVQVMALCGLPVWLGWV